ncbi:MAG TPA: choice-of-anchor D domain-containing protein [Candidatus Acidoferrum sp.]|jgi:hypothetical protein|nr:choice-of-anchor D domain-containing protein [Candidatus Acidoferrum sp.]
MHRLNHRQAPDRAKSHSHAPKTTGVSAQVACLLLIAVTLVLSGCGGSSSSSASQPQNSAVSGNWQFSMTPPDPNYPASAPYGLQGGFLLEKNGKVSGQVAYSIASDQLQNGVPVVCDSGSASVTGTVSGQALTLTAVAGTQTFALSATLGANGSITNGQFTTPGASAGSAVCGAPTPQAGSAVWSAVNVPPLSGSVTGSFHSTGLTLNNQDFQVTGTLNQGENIGASSATVTGSLSFVDPTTLLSDYPCFPAGYVNVTGQISGNTVILQLIGIDGSSDGQIGMAASQVPNSTGLAQVTFDPTQPNGAYMLHSTGQGYQVDTKACRPPVGSSLGEFGFLCLGLNSTTACQQPITLSPPALFFSPQLLMCTAQNCPPNGLGAPTTQTVTLTNNQPPGAAPLTNLTLGFQPSVNQSDFTSVPNFTETDNCSAFLSSSTSGQSCNITITFAPQEGCSWAPGAGGVSVAGCPLPLTATLTVNSPTSADNDTSFAVPITASGLSFVQPSVQEIDFGAEALGEAGLPQLLSFTNQSAYPVQVVGPRNLPCQFSNVPSARPSPVIDDGEVGGLQVVTSVAYFSGPPPTVSYTCDADKVTELPNFQISSDTCTGTNLVPQGTCSLAIAFIPQPSYTQSGNGLDDFLELNTLQCSPGGATSDCEIDSGRFPVELKANGFSPLRMSPSAGLDFGNVPVGKSSAGLTVTLSNDPADPNSATVNFAGKAAVSGNYSETDDCPFSLAPGASCTMTVTFKPSGVGVSQGTISLVYKLGSNTTGNPQFVYLRGTGQ